jgi:arylsulfatase A-like enzyme
MKRFLQHIAILLALVLLTACSTPTASTQPLSSSIAISQSSSISANQPTSQPSNQQTQSPNIIFILTDDLDVAEIAYMPKLQELMVKQGTSFNNALVNVSLCCPSRSTILRGQYSQNTQIIGNNLPDGGYEKFHSNGDEDSTIATWLKDAGYRTMLAGKYLNGYPGPVSQTFVPPGWSEWYSAAKGNAYGEYNYTLNESSKLVEYKKKTEDYGTDVYTRKTIDFIQRTTKEGKPFFVYFAPYAPHSPATPAPRHEKLFADEMLPHPLNFNEADVSDKPAYIKNRPKLTERQISQIQDAYRDRLRSLQAVDDMIGNLFDTLKQTGQLDNTYVFFMSDNGFHLGNHRLATGKWTPYEEDVHVPLVVRGPGVPANVKLDHIIGNSDLASTWAIEIESAIYYSSPVCDGGSWEGVATMLLDFARRSRQRHSTR